MLCRRFGLWSTLNEYEIWTDKMSRYQELLIVTVFTAFSVRPATIISSIVSIDRLLLLLRKQARRTDAASISP